MLRANSSYSSAESTSECKVVNCSDQQVEEVNSKVAVKRCSVKKSSSLSDGGDMDFSATQINSNDQFLYAR